MFLVKCNGNYHNKQRLSNLLCRRNFLLNARVIMITNNNYLTFSATDIFLVKCNRDYDNKQPLSVADIS